jgi:hypothetical protein
MGRTHWISTFLSPSTCLISLTVDSSHTCVIPRRDWKCHSDEGNEEDSEGDTSVKGRTSKGQNNFLSPDGSSTALS